MTALPRPASSPSLNRISSIDALRGLAALLVLIYHARYMFWAGFSQTYREHGLRPDFNTYLDYLFMPFSYGSLGVTLFFVLSGYCIHRRGARMLARDPAATLDLRAFGIRRFWRIYPTYVAALLITAVVDAWLFARTGTRDPAQDNSIGTFIISLLTMQGYFAPFFGSNGVFWTLAMEVHLYLAYPVLFYLSRRHGPSKTLLFTFIVGLVYLAMNTLFDIEQHLPYRFELGPIFLPYWFTWAAGFYVAEIEAGRALEVGKILRGTLMTIGFIIGLALTTMRLGEAAELFWALFFGGLLRWSLNPGGQLFWSGWFGGGLAFVGVFSYSLYAIHAPVLEVVHALIAPTAAYKFATLWPTFGAVGIVIAVAWIFFQLVERWSVRAPKPPAIEPVEELCHG